MKAQLSFSRASSVVRERTMHIVQGQFEVVDDPNVVMTTILGSCVAACIHDTIAGVGGMNHFLLPGDTRASGDSLKYGVNAMELLINGLLKRGASRSRLEGKLFGGAQVVQNLSDIGEQNTAFAREFFRMEGIRCVGESLGGDRARRIRYWPTTGRASQLFLDGAQTSLFRSERRKPAPVAEQASGDLELF